MEKNKDIPLEFKDLDASKRTAIIKHAVYTSIDRVKDISTKGMFTKSWQEGKPDFWFNHIDGASVGSVVNTFEDETGAYTEVKFGKWTLGNDVLEMATEGILKGASFGYKTINKDFVEIKGQKVRRLKEVKHIETSLLTVLPAHPEAGIVKLVKSIETTDDINDLLTLGDEHIQALKSYVAKIENYCRNAKASDESIQWLQKTATEYKTLISSIDTAITQLIPAPIVSDDEVKNQLNNFLNSFNLRQWTLRNN